MNESQAFSGKLVWAALRQLQALRESLTWTLDGEFRFRANKDEARELCTEDKFTDGWTLLSLDERTVPVWLRQQGLDQSLNEKHPSIAATMESYRIHLLGPQAYKALRSGQRTAHQDSVDFGADRSGAGWMRTINFCITSAFVRLLGASEQYEIDLLKALFYHRPTGQPLGHVLDQVVIDADESVIRENPTPDPDEPNRLIYTKPPVWTWVKKHAENNEERRKILTSVFGIDTTGGATNNERKENNKHRQTLYEKRNAIAHGRRDIEMTLAEYVEADVFVYTSIAYLAEQCRTKHMLIV